MKLWRMILMMRSQWLCSLRSLLYSVWSLSSSECCLCLASSLRQVGQSRGLSIRIMFLMVRGGLLEWRRVAKKGRVGQGFNLWVICGRTWKESLWFFAMFGVTKVLGGLQLHVCSTFYHRNMVIQKTTFFKRDPPAL